MTITGKGRLRGVDGRYTRAVLTPGESSPRSVRKATRKRFTPVVIGVVMPLAMTWLDTSVSASWASGAQRTRSPRVASVIGGRFAGVT